MSINLPGGVLVDRLRLSLVRVPLPSSPRSLRCPILSVPYPLGRQNESGSRREEYPDVEGQEAHQEP